MEWLAAYYVLTLLAYLAMVGANLFFYRKRSSQPIEPFTVIKPIKGAEEGLKERLASILESDPEGKLQILFAMESKDDPAYAPALAAAESFPGRDVEIVITGPSGERMGKIHNMIEALAHAKYPRVVFSDADVKAGPPLIRASSQAFASGAQVFYSTPYVHRLDAFPESLMAYAFNHGFCVASALHYYIGVLRGYSGAWMGFTRDALGKIGGLERFEKAAADDYALGTAARKSGIPIRLLAATSELQEHAPNFPETLAHFFKWGVIIRAAGPEIFWIVLVHVGLMTAFALAALLFALSGSWAFTVVYAAGVFIRMAGPLIQDLALLGRPLPLWFYPLVPLLDLGFLFFWTSTLAADRFTWRGKTYAVRSRGMVEVV